MKVRCLLYVWMLQLCGCAVLNLPENLNRVMLNQEDPALIRDSLPTMMLIADALIEGEPDESDYLINGAKLYSAYSGAFLSQDPERSALLSVRAYDYAQRALCEELEDLCVTIDAPYDQYIHELHHVDDEDDLEVLYSFASAWAGLVQAKSDDWTLIAQLPKVKATIQQVLTLDENYDRGTAQIYAGVLETLLPPSLGGKPEAAKQHFEKAIAFSEEKNLFAKVMYAKQYARLLFEQELHDRLLNQVINADPKQDGLTLMNTLAIKQAKALLAESAEYFE